MMTLRLVTRWINEVVVLKWGQYSNGRLALQFILAETGEPMAVATVNLPDEPLADGETFIKSYGENEGMVEALADLRMIERTGRFVASGFVAIEVCRWLIQPE